RCLRVAVGITETFHRHATLSGDVYLRLHIDRPQVEQVRGVVRADTVLGITGAKGVHETGKCYGRFHSIPCSGSAAVGDWVYPLESRNGGARRSILAKWENRRPIAPHSGL